MNNNDYCTGGEETFPLCQIMTEEPIMLHHANTHVNCYCYQKGEGQTISLKKFSRGSAGSSRLTSHYIFFVIDGQARYTLAGSPDKAVVVSSGEFVFLPLSMKLVWEALLDTSVMSVRLSGVTGQLPECHTFQLQRHYGNLETAPNEEWGIYPLKMNSRIHYLVKGIITTQLDGLKCGNFAKHLVGMLLTMIQVYYPQREYMRFYSTLAGSDAAFTDGVYGKWRTCRTAGELASALNMTERQFNSHFRKTFGENPGSWLQERRREQICHDVYSTVTPLSVVAVKHGFSMTNLIRYCRLNFGDTPGNIRKNLLFCDDSPTYCAVARRDEVAKTALEASPP